MALLARAWGLDASEGAAACGAADAATLVPLSMCGAMALVRLPPRLVRVAAAAAGGDVAAGSGGGGSAAEAVAAAGEPPATSADAKWVQDALHILHRIECPVKCVRGRLWVRISAAAYNELQDYQKLADAVHSMLPAAEP